jgi:hypothetical protein
MGYVMKESADHSRGEEKENLLKAKFAEFLFPEGG